jgi:hypothetical protein
MHMLEWFATNKEAMIAIAALISPIVAVAGTVLASIVSYRAVVTGPRVQREISREQFELTSRQLDLQERAMAANLLGTADQKWIEDFRVAIAELEGWVTEQGLIVDTQKKTGNPNYDIDRLLEITRQVEPVIAKVRLMVGQTSPNMPLVAVVRQWLVAGDMTKRVALGAEVFAAAHQIIERKYAGIAARVAAVAHVSTPPDPSVMEHK